MAAPRGIVRYNKIRRELSQDLKKRGVKLEAWAFNDLSRDIFRLTKTDPFSRLMQSVGDMATTMRKEGVPPILPVQRTKAEIEQGIEPKNKGAVNYWDIDNLPYESFPENLIISSPNVLGKDVRRGDYTYELDAKPMVQWVDKNRDREGDDDTKLFRAPDYGPFVRLVGQEFNAKMGGYPAKFNYDKLSWEFDLVFADSNGDIKNEEGQAFDYGYDPGMAPQYIPPEEVEAIRPEEPVKKKKKKKPPAKKRKIQMELKLKKAETKLLKQEVRLKKAEASAARERLALVKELRDIGFTKAEIKAELAKL